MKKFLPPREMAWLDPATGRPTDIFWDYIRNVESRSLGQAVSITDTPSNGETPLYNATSGLWEYGGN